MAKELYYFYVSVDDGSRTTDGKKKRKYFRGFTVATSESVAQSQACSYIHEKYFKNDKYFNCTAMADNISHFINSEGAVPNTIATETGRIYGASNEIDDTLEYIKIGPKMEDK